LPLLPLPPLLLSAPPFGMFRVLSADGFPVPPLLELPSLILPQQLPGFRYEKFTAKSKNPYSKMGSSGVGCTDGNFARKGMFCKRSSHNEHKNSPGVHGQRPCNHRQLRSAFPYLKTTSRVEKCGI
jgi:hypothetical protein